MMLVMAAEFVLRSDERSLVWSAAVLATSTTGLASSPVVDDSNLVAGLVQYLYHKGSAQCWT